MSSQESARSRVPLTSANWLINSRLLWQHRRRLVRVKTATLVLSAIIAFAIPKHYESTARLMPPDQQMSGSALLAAVAGRSAASLGSLGSLAGGLFGARTSGALYIDLLRSRTVSDHLIDRFNLQHVYWKRYRVDTAKYLARHTSIADDKKSGVIIITVDDTDPERARDLAQAYVDELNSIVNRSNTSAARREKEFIEKRLIDVKTELREAETALSNFSSVNTTLDIKEQTRTMVDAAAKLQAELIVSHSELDALTQTYGEGNIRVRATRARIASLQKEFTKLNGTSGAATENMNAADPSMPYPSLRQLPRLAVPYADLYRRVRIQETVFELLSQQYELSRIDEVKDTPVVKVIDIPQIAEKKSFPPRLVLMLAATVLSFFIAASIILAQYQWAQINSDDPRRLLAQDIGTSLKTRLDRVLLFRRSTQ